MSITAAQIGSLITEIAPRLAGGVIRAAWCANEYSFTIEVRAEREECWLLFSCEPGAARFHLEPGKPRQPPETPAFVMLLRERFEGARIRSLLQVPGDRIVRLEAGDEALALLAELTGRHANILLLDGAGTILGSLLPNRSRRRRLVPGEAYQPPAPPPAAAGPGIERDDLGLADLPADGSRSGRLREHYRERLERAAASRAARELLRRLRAASENLTRRIDAISRDLARARGAQDYRIRGELLRSAHGKVERGMESVVVPDYYTEGMPPIEIPLDPTLDLQGNIDRCFRLYRKYHQAAPKIEERLEKMEKNRRRISDRLDEASRLAGRATAGEVGEGGDEEPLDPAEGLQLLEALRERTEAEKLLRPDPGEPARRKAAAAARALPYREHRSKTGKTILVGKGGRHNDALTLRIARGSDLWLHAQDWAGAHVVVRLAKNEEIDEETLLDAATLAAHHSKARGAAIVPILYTHAKHVRKPKHLPPGRVLTAAARTLTLRIEKDRLARLLSREEG